jgi:hypothetical protein
MKPIPPYSSEWGQLEPVEENCDCQALSGAAL